MLSRAPEEDKPTVLLMIDRNELEDQMLKNLAALGLGNLEHASSIRRLNELLKNDYRGIIVTMIHKFRDMPANLNLRKNTYVLVDEAHRTTGGDRGNFLMAGLPNATFIGFTGTPVDKTAFGKGTFKTFGGEDDEGYLHKYSIADSIGDGTTLPLYYQLAPNEMLVPHETLDKEFLSLAEIGKNSQRKKQQVEKGLDGLSYFERCKLTEDGITNPEKVSGKIRDAFGKHPGGKDGEGELREQVTLAVCSEEDDLDKVAVTVASLSGLLEKAFRK